MPHPLDRPTWTALNGRQSGFARHCNGICRYDPAFAPFAASATGTATSYIGLANLVPEGSEVYVQEAEQISTPPGLVLQRSEPLVRMVLETAPATEVDLRFDLLTAADASELRELARLTKPGPFAERTHELGRFIGVRRDGRLIAMAGERMKADRYTEVSGVCTHPHHRGKGYAAKLMTEIARGISARGEIPFLHAYASNTGAILLYEKLGYVTRWSPIVTVFTRDAI